MSAIAKIRELVAPDKLGPNPLADAIIELADRLDKIAPVREPVRDPDGHEVRDDDGWTVTEDGVAMFRGNAIAWMGPPSAPVYLVVPECHATTRIPLSVVRKMLAVAP